MKPVGFTLILLTGLSSSAFADQLFTVLRGFPFTAASSTNLLCADLNERVDPNSNAPVSLAPALSDFDQQTASVERHGRGSLAAAFSLTVTIAGPSAVEAARATSTLIRPGGNLLTLGAAKKLHFGRFSAYKE